MCSSGFAAKEVAGHLGDPEVLEHMPSQKHASDGLAFALAFSPARDALAASPPCSAASYSSSEA